MLKPVLSARLDDTSPSGRHRLPRDGLTPINTYPDFAMQTLTVIDSHTGGEPTRLIVAGGPDLGQGSMAERLNRFARDYDHLRSATVCEPRGSDVIVGALLCEPQDPSHTAGVIFFNNVGFLGMCGHGTIGLINTLAYMGKIGVGVHQIETPVGLVSAELHDDHSVTVHNVSSYRYRQQVEVEVAGHGKVYGDIAWGGNWFFLVSQHGQSIQLENVEALTEFSWKLRQALEAQGITGANGGLIDHIELFGDAGDPANHSRNFVLCPGKAYDRSPCGTGTSAKLACLAADGKLQPGQIWRQESILGSVFAAHYQADPKQAGAILPSLRGRAWVNAKADLLLAEDDPFCFGIRA